MTCPGKRVLLHAGMGRTESDLAHVHRRFLGSPALSVAGDAGVLLDEEATTTG